MNDSSPGTAAYVEQIRRRYPALAIETVAFNQNGQYNDVLIVNRDLIFRFAKVTAAVDTLRQEITILHSLQAHLALAIPNPIYHNLETDVVGEAFAGYRMIAGQPLWREELDAIGDAAARTRMAGQLAAFLRELHQIDAATVIPIVLPLVDTRAEVATMYARIRTELFAYMRPDARQQITCHFEEFLKRPDHHTFLPTLRHGDFGPGNILYAPETGSLTGIIDFGAIGLGDPAVDFAGLYISYGQDFYAQCTVVYPAMAEALPRVRFYCGAFALEEALFGLDNDNREAFAAGMAGYV